MICSIQIQIALKENDNIDKVTKQYMEVTQKMVPSCYFRKGTIHKVDMNKYGFDVIII
jgi:hypothetical protein